MTDAFKACVLVPTYNNPMTIRPVVEKIRAHGVDVLVIDDGSAEEAREACAQLAEDGLAMVVHRRENGGKGAAVKTGFQEALARGYTHALQVDADNQHDLSVITDFVNVARANPDALVLSVPVFDDSAPAARQIGRKISIFWVNLETGGRVIHDPLCGYRVYPLADAVAVNVPSDRMNFDPEIAVRLAWRGLPVINLPLKVWYPSKEEGAVTHFRVFSDNFALAWLHTRLCVEKVFGMLIGRRYRGTTRLLGSGA